MSVEKLLNRGRANAAIGLVAGLTQSVNSFVESNRSLRDKSMTDSVFSMESMSPERENSIKTVYGNVEATLRSLVSDTKISCESFQFEAASMASIAAADPLAAVRSSPRLPATTQAFRLTRPQIGDGNDVRGLSLEAYDERDNRSAQTHSIIYNLLASRQDDFGETHYPTIAISSAEAGILLEARLLLVYRDFKRSTSGSLANYGRVNVIRAYTDPSVLKNDQTLAIPVVRTGGADDNTASFVAATDVAVIVKDNEGTLVNTAPLKVGKSIDMIGISQTAELLASGVMGPTDVLDTYARLDKVYIKFDDGANTSVVAFDTEPLPDSVFTYAPAGNSRRMILNLDTTSLVFSSATKDVNGATPAAWGAITPGVTGRLKLSISGSLVLDTATGIVNNGSVGLVVLRDASGALMSPSVAVQNLFNNAVTIGYDLTVYRANVNLRQRGQLVDEQVERQVVNVRFRSPVARLVPTGDTSGNDSSTIQTLITITNARTSNEAVAALLKAEAALSSYVSVPDSDGVLPDLFGIGRYYVKPTFFKATIDMSATVDSLKSHERFKDLRAALIEKIRYYATEMYRTSEYKAASTVLFGNIDYVPTVNIGTDLVLYNYLMADNDFRTLGDQFNVKLVATQNKNFANRIILTFGVYDSTRNSLVNPLNNGNMLWSPETVVVLPISRDGQTSKEMIVAPRFLHMTNLPVMTSLTVTNLPAALNKVSLNQHVV
jgi:hypothetical protein